MITITTTEKWVEFDSMEMPVKETDNVIFLALTLERKGEITIGFEFGKIEDNDFKRNSNTFLEMSATLQKTSQEIEAYSYNQLHADAKAYLEFHCISPNTTFDIL